MFKPLTISANKQRAGKSAGQLLCLGGRAGWLKISARTGAGRARKWRGGGVVAMVLAQCRCKASTIQGLAWSRLLISNQMHRASCQIGALAVRFAPLWGGRLVSICLAQLGSEIWEVSGQYRAPNRASPIACNGTGPCEKSRNLKLPLGSGVWGGGARKSLRQNGAQKAFAAILGFVSLHSGLKKLYEGARNVKW